MWCLSRCSTRVVLVRHIIIYQVRQFQNVLWISLRFSEIFSIEPETVRFCCEFGISLQLRIRYGCWTQNF